MYDGDGKRVKATVDGQTTVYVGDYYEVGVTTKKYYAIGGVRVAMRDNATLRYLLGDHLGSTSITADSAGAKVAELSYKAWGENRYTNGTTPTSYHFTGQREESGLGAGVYFYQARWYDAALGRFLQADSIVPQPGNPQSFNRYSYTLNNPVKYRDPSGHVVETAWDIANVAWDIHEFANDRSVGNFVALALDAGAVLLPFVPAGVGILLRGGKIADKTLDAAKVVSKAEKLADAAKAADKAKDAMQSLRQGYVTAVRGLALRADEMRAVGSSTEEIARSLHAERRSLGEMYKNMTSPDLLEQIYQRNLEKYQDKLGPTIEWLRDRGKTWDEIIESASRPGGQDLVPQLLDQ